MNIKNIILLIFLTTVYSSTLIAQDIEFKNYSYNVNNDYFKLNFSFDIPKIWTINDEYDGTGYQVNCTSSHNSDSIEYRNCFEDIIFKVKYFHSNLDSALLTMGLQKKSENMYLTKFDGKIKIEITTDIKGDTYSGLYYTISNDIKCKSGKEKKVIGQFQFIYFSNGVQTICIETNGRGLNEIIFKRIIDSFKFS